MRKAMSSKRSGRDQSPLQRSGFSLKDLLLGQKGMGQKYKKLLKKAGKEVVQNMRLSEATREELEKPIIPHDMYMKGANKEWDRQLKEIPPKG